jgi:hypothetical protein
MSEEKKPPPRPVGPDGIIHVQYTSDYLDYVGHKLEKQAKGEPVETYFEYLDRRAGEKILTTEELLRRLQ